MSESPSPENQEQLHRWFAVECNNRAWDLTLEPASAGRDQEMLENALASAYHWRAVGTEQNIMRATMLVGHVLALCSSEHSGLSKAEASVEYFAAQDDTPDWELALAHLIHAQTAGVAGRHRVAETARENAEAALSAITDAGDRALVQKSFDVVFGESN